MRPFLKGTRFNTITSRYFCSCRSYTTTMADNKAKDNGTREVKILMLHGKR